MPGLATGMVWCSVWWLAVSVRIVCRAAVEEVQFERKRCRLVNYTVENGDALDAYYLVI